VNITPPLPGGGPFIEQGGVFAVPNLRGGGEYGETCIARHAGAEAERVRRLHRSAEFLIGEKITSRDRLAISGGRTGACWWPRSSRSGLICSMPLSAGASDRHGPLSPFPHCKTLDPGNAQPKILSSSSSYTPTRPITTSRTEWPIPHAHLHRWVGHARRSPARAQVRCAPASGTERPGPILLRLETGRPRRGKPLGKSIEQYADEMAFLSGSSELGPRESGSSNRSVRSRNALPAR